MPPDEFWQEYLITSRLTEYEVFNRLHARKLWETHAEDAQALLGRMSLVELSQPILARALEPFPLPVRTLDALHLASFHFLSILDPKLTLATYDNRLTAAARKMKFKLHPL